MDTRLLARAVADHLAVGYKTHRVGLGVLQGDERQQHVAAGVFGDLTPAGDDVVEQVIAGDYGIASLLERNPEHLALFEVGGLVRRVDLDQGVAAATLGFE